MITEAAEGEGGGRNLESLHHCNVPSMEFHGEPDYGGIGLMLSVECRVLIVEMRQAEDGTAEALGQLELLQLEFLTSYHFILYHQ
jgi:hypothetical protein